MVREETGDNFFGATDTSVMNLDCVPYYPFMSTLSDLDDICSSVFRCWNVTIRIYYDTARFLFHSCKPSFTMFFELEAID